MEPKKSKYDTNPLDPDFVKNVDAGSAENKPETQEVQGATREIGSSANENARQNIYSEAPTRRYDHVSPDAPYPSIFVPPTYSPPAPYQPPATPYRPVEQKPTHRTVAGIGLPEKWAMILPYAPFYIGVGVVLSTQERTAGAFPRRPGSGAAHRHSGCADVVWSGWSNHGQQNRRVLIRFSRYYFPDRLDDPRLEGRAPFHYANC